MLVHEYLLNNIKINLRKTNRQSDYLAGESREGTFASKFKSSVTSNRSSGKREKGEAEEFAHPRHF